MVQIAERIEIVEKSQTFLALPTEITTVIYLGREAGVSESATLDPAPDTLSMLRVLDSVMIEDSQNEPSDFVVPGDDLGF